MDFFSDEIIMIILSRIPTLELTRLQCVCKRWKSIVKEPLFRRLHYGHSMSNPMDNQFLVVQHPQGQKLLFQSLTDKTRYIQTRLLIGHPTPSEIRNKRLRSDNGLLLFCDGALGSIFIMNPFTNQSMKLPKPDGIWSQHDLRACGFSFDPTKNLYKVVIIVHVPSQIYVWRNYHQLLMLFDSSSTKWRSIGWIDYVISDKSQVLMNGRLHWMVDEKIVSFDLANEKLSLIALPDPLIQIFGFSNQFACSTLMVFGGYLCVVYHFRRIETLSLQIWFMKEYGAEKSWVKEFDMECLLPSELRATEIFMEAVGEIENGKILMRFDADWQKGPFAILCEPKHQRYKFIGQKEMPVLSDWRNRVRSIIHNANLCWVTP